MNKNTLISKTNHKQWLLLLLTTLLTACLEEEKDSSLNLPPINPNLSTESAIGTWLFHIKIRVTEFSIDSSSQREVDDHYFIRQFMTISMDEYDGEYRISSGCYNGGSLGSNSKTTIQTSDTNFPYKWHRDTAEKLIFFASPHSSSGYWPLPASPYLWYSREVGQLKLENNLSLSGELHHKMLVSKDSRQQEEFDPYYAIFFGNTDDLEYHKSMEVQAVKLSDSTSLEDAKEISFDHNIQSDLLNINSQNSFPTCISSVEKNSLISTYNNQADDSKAEIEAQAIKAFYLGLDDSDESTSNALLLTLHQDLTKNSTHFTLASDYSNYYHIFNSCSQEETDSDCTDPLAIKVILDTEQDNKLALNAVINELESDSVNVRASISF